MNQKIIAITSFPPKGLIHGEQVVGIASYAKNTFRSMLKAKGANKVRLEVLAEQLKGDTDYKEGKINVKRIWKRNSFSIFPTLFRQILKEKESDTVLIEFELAMFGSLLYLLPFPIFLLALKLLGKKIILVLHQVIPDMDEIAPHINLDAKSFKTDLMGAVLKYFYKYLLIISSKVIVFEEDLKDRLTEVGSARKIVVIPHGVEEFRNTPTKFDARKKLGISKQSYVIMSFGFLAWYKGTDWLVHAIDSLKRDKKIQNGNIQLVLAGGPNPNHENKEYYQRYIRNIKNICAKNGFILTGFVPQNKIPLYFKACDLVVLPYRTFMSSSGPLSITFSFKKPFLLSPKLRGVLVSDDFQKLMTALRLKEKDFVFGNFNGDFAKKISKLRRNSTFAKRIARFSGEVKKARSWNVIGTRYLEEIVN